MRLLPFEYYLLQIIVIIIYKPNYSSLLNIFYQNDSVKLTTSARLKRYAIFLNFLDYTIDYKTSTVNAKAESIFCPLVIIAYFVDFEVAFVQVMN